MNSKSRRTKSQKHNDFRSPMVLAGPHFFFFSFLLRETPKVCSSVPPLNAQLLLQLQKKQKEGRTKAQKTETKPDG